MAPKEKILKGQRPISSFFFAKPEKKVAGKRALSQSSTAPVDTACKRTQPTSHKESIQAHDGQNGEQPPKKRMRPTDASLQQREKHGAKSEAAPAYCTAQEDGNVCLQNGSPERSSVSKGVADGHCSVDLCGSPSPDREPPGVSGRTAPLSDAAQARRHERFQNKLVLGPASGLQKRGSAVDIVPQKRTPLEEQVYELKRKHPGVLLVIEVSNKEALTRPQPTGQLSHSGVSIMHEFPWFASEILR